VEIGVGQKYGFQIKNITVPTNASAALDIFTITAAASIPILIQRFVTSANVNQAQNVPVVVSVRSATGSGGTAGGSGTAFTSVAEPPSGANATETLAYNVTTVGTLVKEVASSLWQLFGTYEFQRKPGGFLLTPGQTFALSVPLGGIGTSFVAAVEGEYIALK
jgi:hypothetical protein